MPRSVHVQYKRLRCAAPFKLMMCCDVQSSLSVKQCTHFAGYVALPATVPQLGERLQLRDLQEVYLQVKELLVRVARQVSLQATRAR